MFQQKKTFALYKDKTIDQLREHDPYEMPPKDLLLKALQDLAQEFRSSRRIK